MIFTVHITIMPLTELLDPQGKAVHESLGKLGLGSIQDVRIGKQVDLKVEATSKEEAMRIADEACKKMLYNPVMEQYHITTVE
jgi:phosphoribosylformylglycinamidine synthase PurS subunit